MRTLYTIACPEVDDRAQRFIERVRAAHDPQHAVVEAHLTLLFGSAVTDEAAYADHVRAVAGRTGPIRFACRKAVTHPGAAMADAGRLTGLRIGTLQDGGFRTHSQHALAPV